jgi:hypothetical protein
MPPPHVLAGTQPGFVRYVMQSPYSGSADGHNSSVYYDVEVNEKIVNLETIQQAVGISCQAPFGDGITSPTLANQVNGTTFVNTTAAEAQVNGTLVVEFSSAAAAEAFAVSWLRNNNILALVSTWGCGNAFRQVQAVLGFVGTTGVVFETTDTPLSDCFRNGHFSYNVTNTESTGSARRRRRDLSTSSSTTVSNLHRHQPGRSAGRWLLRHNLGLRVGHRHGRHLVPGLNGV